MSDRCYWLRDGDDILFIPACMGGAVGGPEGCTCDFPLSDIEREREARQAAEEYIDKLMQKAMRRNAFVDALMRKNKQLCAEIKRLEARLTEKDD